jgi:ketosteroid isomerase-like protein
MSVSEVMHQYLDAARRGDFDAAFEYFADDISIRIPGRSAQAGVYRGRDAAIAYIQSARALSHDADVELELVDALTSDERFSLIVNERFRRDDGDIVISRANVYRVLDGKIIEVSIFENDQYAVDELFAGAETTPSQPN